MKSTPLTVPSLILTCLVAALGCNSASDVNLSGQTQGTSSGSSGSISAGSSSETAAEVIDTEPVISGETAESSTNKTWTVAEILSETRSGGAGGTALCGGELGFKRCICAEDVPGSIQYRPSVAECNGNAAAILYDNYAEAFSVVVRDSQNRDRWPASGFNGCSAQLSNSDSPPNKCSAFKVQDKFAILDGAAVVHCFGASGYSALFSDAVRLTIKLENVPNSNDDPLVRVCLISGDLPLN